MKKTIYFTLFLIVLGLFQVLYAQQTLIVHDDFINETDTANNHYISDHYDCRVKFVNEPETAWRDVAVLQTRAKEGNGQPPAEDLYDAYYDSLEGFTASWITFESVLDINDNNDDVIVEISKINGTITKAMVRPVGEAEPATISNGKAYVIFKKHANINVDINGQMEDHYTGYGYNKSQNGYVHTISIFANPIFNAPTGTDVMVVQPGTDYTSINRETYPKLVFAPGVHDLGMEFPINSNEVLYIPGNAIVEGTIHPPNSDGDQTLSPATGFKVYGSGTISGVNIVRNPTDKGKQYKPFTYRANGLRLEGFVVADPAFHTFNMGHKQELEPGEDEEDININVYKNLKILAWRRNSDGINAFEYSEVSDCFFRVQDDAFYYGRKNVNQYNNTVWNDANGAVIFLDSINNGSSSTFKDVKVIYHRSHWHWWEGGRIVSIRQFRDNYRLKNVTISNILVEDPKPAFPPFYATMTGSNGTNMEIENVVFEDIVQLHDGFETNTAAEDSNGKPQNTLIGHSMNRKWENITFKRCKFKGKQLKNFQDGEFYKLYVKQDTNPNAVKFLADTIVSFTVPSSVVQGETYNTTVEYYTSEDNRDLEVFFQLNKNPWTHHGQSSKVSVQEAGNGTVGIDFTVDSGFTINADPSKYKLTAVLYPDEGNWNTRLDDLIKPGIIVDPAPQQNKTLVNTEINIFPNPAKGKVFVRSKQQIQQIQITSLSGSILFDKVIQKGKTKSSDESTGYPVDVSKYAKGVYFIEVTNESGRSISKLIIE